MKKYALMIAASGLFCMFQVQSSEKSLRTFKHEITQQVAFSAEIYGDGGLNYVDAMSIARHAKNEAIAKRIPFNKAASIVIDTLAQRAFDDLKGFGVTDQGFRQRVLNTIKETVNDVFDLVN